ncbi:uncharacterized protein LOC106638052 isoform X2 [Copidosoma floridanum]|uniref:uncharacterized protein LOC106638052 isoform X2 n=1 Tax=Copidosoma floridanum TaxID=29053 RepID=UPI0006C99A79|nr:uncharacterized protein LOC106638052 isoform X2 [Copidosoma floridanum]
MKITTTILVACLCIASAVSLPFNNGLQSQALDQLMVDETVNDPTFRSKRTIGILRQLFPDITKMIEDKVNAIVGEIIKIFGPVVFQSILGGNKNAGGGGGGEGASKSSGSTVEAKNPFDDDDASFTDDDDFFNAPAQSGGGSMVSVGLPTGKGVESTSAKVEETSSSAGPEPEGSGVVTTASSRDQELTTVRLDDSATNSVQ